MLRLIKYPPIYTTTIVPFKADEHVSKDIPPAIHEEREIVADKNEDVEIVSDSKPVVSNEESQFVATEQKS